MEVKLQCLCPQGEKGDMGLPGTPGGAGTKVRVMIACVKKETKSKTVTLCCNDTEASHVDCFFSL